MESKQRPVNAKPGEVYMHNFYGPYRRPWLVLWVDDEEDSACAIALSTNGGFPGAVPIKHLTFKYAAAWAQLTKPWYFDPKYRKGYIDKAERERIAREVQKNLDLIGD
jgi:hypothetical protein